MKNTILSIKSLYKSFSNLGGNSISVLKDVNLNMEKGDFISIMGSSGSGKSTLLNILASIDNPTKGTVIVNNFNLSESDKSVLIEIRRNITSIIYQDFNLLEYLTASENIKVPMMLNGEKDEEFLNERTYELLNKLSIQNIGDQLPEELSGGQRQRVAIARALSNSPKVILADEPTGNLDTKTGDAIMSIFRKLADDGITIIMVTHNLRHAKKSDRILVLRDGKLQSREEMDEVNENE